MVLDVVVAGAENVGGVGAVVCLQFLSSGLSKFPF